MGLSCWLVLGKCWSTTGGSRSGTVVLVCFREVWSRTGGPRSGTVVLAGFREVLEQDWWSSQWDCSVGWF